MPDPAREALGRAVAFAERSGLDLDLVGGGVRDLLLGAGHVDLDLVVEGDAIALASLLGEALGARVVAHPRFGTAVVQSEGLRLDFARARAERYERPGALPAVTPAGLSDDLARRDFTINAMALRLSGGHKGRLIDPHGGRDDLHRRLVRVLHDGSFQDDATRILRALRYAGRLGFALETKTQSLLERDLSYLDTISGARLRHELERIAEEEAVAGIARLGQEFGALAAVHPSLQASERVLRALEALPDLARSRRDAVLFSLLLADAPAGDVERAIARLALTGRQMEAVRGLVALREREPALAVEGLQPSAAVALLAPAPMAAIEAFALIAERPLAAGRARRYLAEWRFVRPRLNGRDIEALGVPRGPRVGVALALLREARLDDGTHGRDDEIELVRRQVLGERRLAGAARG